MHRYLRNVPLISAIVLALISRVLSDSTTQCSVVQGLPGLNGRDGRDGAHGLKGDPGPPGEPGVRGMAGPPGKAGPKGNQGDKGIIGFPGAVGQKGQKGDSATSALEELKRQVASMDGRLNALQSSMAVQKKALLFARGISAGEKLFVTNGQENKYSEASTVCSTAGGQMASPRNMAENQAVMAMGLQYNKMPFLGINDIITEGSFRYQTGESISYSNWNPREPNNDQGVEDCVEMHASGTWNDKNCEEKRLTICEFS